MGRGKASVNAAAANSASRPASDDRERPSSARLAAAAATMTVAPTVTRSTSESTPGSCDAAFVLTWSTTPPFVGRGPRPVSTRLLLSLQSSHRGGRLSSAGLSVPVDDPAAREVVRRELDVDAIARQDLDPVTPHLARGVAERLVAVVELDLVHAVAECLDDLALELDLVFLACDGRHLLENDPRAAAKVSCRGAGELVGLTKS